LGLILDIQDAVRASITEIYKISVKAKTGLNKDDVESIIMMLIKYPPEKKVFNVAGFRSTSPYGN